MLDKCFISSYFLFTAYIPVLLHFSSCFSFSSIICLCKTLTVTSQTPAFSICTWRRLSIFPGHFVLPGSLDWVSGHQASPSSALEWLFLGSYTFVILVIRCFMWYIQWLPNNRPGTCSEFWHGWKYLYSALVLLGFELGKSSPLFCWKVLLHFMLTSKVVDEKSDACLIFSPFRCRSFCP